MHPLTASTPAHQRGLPDGNSAPAAPSTQSPRERILAAAAELFYASGINSVGVDAIVAKSGVAKMTLYKHFASKDLLIAAWLRHSSEQWRSDLERSLERIAMTPQSKLESIFDVLAEWFADPTFRGCAFINCVAEIADPSHPARIVAAEHRRLVRAYLARLAFDAGYTAHEELGEALAMLADGATVAALAERSPEPARHAAAIAAILLSQSKKTR